MSKTKKLIERFNRIINDPNVVWGEQQLEDFTEIKKILATEPVRLRVAYKLGLEQQAQPELVSVCCKAKIKIEKIECSNGYYNAEICSKCDKEIVETLQAQPEELVEKILEIGRLCEMDIHAVIGSLEQTKEEIRLSENKAKAEIRTLLQRGTESVTREEIDSWFEFDGKISQQRLEKRLKSIGVEVKND